MTSSAPIDQVNRRGEVTRRQFLGWSAAAAVGALWSGPGWALGRPIPGLGIVGLGERGRRTLAMATQLKGLEVAAVCDLDASALAGAAGEFERFGEAARLFASSQVQAVVLAVPASAVPALTREALAAGQSVLLTRPIPWELTAADVEPLPSDCAEIVPRLHFSLGRTAAGFSPEPAAKSAAVELVARSREELASLAPEALEAASAWLGGQPVSSRGVGGPTIGSATGFGARGTVLLEHCHSGRQRLDFSFRIDPNRSPSGRMTIAGQGGELSLGLWPRSGGAPNANDLVALLAGREGSGCGLKLSLWSKSAQLFRELMAEIGD